MNELKFLGYYTVYSYTRINKGGEKLVVFDRERAICFRRLFDNLRSNVEVEYTIFVSTDLEALKHSCDNYCFLDKAGITKHVRLLKQIIPEFKKFSVVPTIYNGFNGYDITIRMAPAKCIKHKYVLTWVRYLYETSFSLALLDSTRLAKLPEFRFISYENLINIVMACFPSHFPNYNTWHAIGLMTAHKFLTKKQLSKTLNKRIYKLNDLYPHKDANIKQLGANFRDKKYSLDFWNSQESFTNERLPIYKECLECLKAE